MKLRIHADRPEWIARHMPGLASPGAGSRIIDAGEGLIHVHTPSGDQADAIIFAALIARRAARLTGSRLDGIQAA